MCVKLPPLGSEERDKLRKRLNAKSLEEALEELHSAAVDGMEEEGEGMVVQGDHGASSGASMLRV